MTRDFWISVWSWLITPVGDDTTVKHRRRRGDPKPGSFGHYRGHHRMSKSDITPEAGAWFRKHQREFAAAYDRVRERAA